LRWALRRDGAERIRAEPPRRHDTLPLRDAFAVLFFVSVGMLFDPMVLIQQPLAVLGTLAIIIFGKSVAAFFLVRCSATRRARR
jgi:predicted Kef-type K+ transport protein